MAHVVVDVAEIHSEAHLAGLVADGGHAIERIVPRVRVAAVAPHVGRPVVEVVRTFGMRLGIEVVEDGHLDATSDEVVDDMGTDESGAAGDKNAHWTSVVSH